MSKMPDLKEQHTHANVDDFQHITNTPEPTTTAAEGIRESKFARNVVIAVFISAVLFLASISIWLWYGAHQFQDCL